MDICCAKVGNGTVNFQPDCYSWCNLDVSQDDEDDVDRVQDTFVSCLQSGENGRPTLGRLCGGASSSVSQDDSQDDSEGSGEAETGSAAPVRGSKRLAVLLVLCGSLVLGMLYA